MNMDLNELILKMTYAASQVAQSTLPQTQNQTQTEDGKSFQTLLEEKQTERTDNQGNTEQKPTTTTETTVANNAVAQEVVAALLNQVGQANMVQPAVATAEASGMTIQTVAAVVPQTPMVDTEAVEIVLPQQQPVTEMAGEQIQSPELLVQTDEQTVETPVVEPQTLTAPVENTDATRGQEVPQEVEVTVENGGTDYRQEPELEDTAVQTDGLAQPLFEDTEVMPQRVGDAPVIDTEQADMDQQMTGKLTEALSEGSRRVEVKLTPEHLGRVVVEMQQDADGILQVVLHAETPEAAKLLSQHSDALGLMLQGTQHTEVRVEVQQPQQDQPSQQQPDQNGGRNQGQHQQEQRRQQSDPERFLQQLRLGLLST